MGVVEMSEQQYGTVVVTGANRGIGLEFARRLAPESRRLLACCRQPDEAEALLSLASANDSVEIVRLDVTSDADIDALAGALDGEPVDLLLNNAGIYGPRGRPPLDHAGWHEVLSVNTMAPLRVAGALLDNVAASDRRLVANVTSKMGSIGDNAGGGAYVYRSSKAALNAVMVSLARDTADRGVTVLLLHPGWVQTDMGGPNALIDVETSVSGMKAIIDRATTADSGCYFDYDGSRIPW